MMGKIGAKRMTLLMVLIALVAALGLSSEFVFAPKNAESQQKLRSVTGEAATLQTEITKMKGDFAAFEHEKAYFETISRMGFFNDQDRVLARERFDTMQKLSKIISARYEIKAANVLTDEADPETGFVVMESPITVTLSAVDDLDVYRFIYYLNYGFPGHITINNLNMERKAEISPTILKEIGTGNPPEIITAKLDLDWRTMARKESIVQHSAGAPADQKTPGTGEAKP